jgi:hypothetical protein
MNNNSVMSIDLAKNVFQVCLLNPHNNQQKSASIKVAGNGVKP